MKPLSFAALQFDISWENKTENLTYLSQTIGELPKEDRVVLLPEMFSTGFSMNKQLAETMDGDTIHWMRSTAKQEGRIICGTVMIAEHSQFFNRLIWMLPNGQFHYYDKRHLFAYGAENTVFSPGNKRLIVQANGWKFCLMVCYDLRFPVWCRQQILEPFDVLVFLANWPERRSHAWRTLLQARAIENQCYVIGVNRVGTDGQDVLHSGESMIVNPLGIILNEGESGKNTSLRACLDPTEPAATRNQFPFLKDADRFLLL